MRRILRPREHRVDGEYVPRSTGARASSRRVSGNARPETHDRTSTASVRDRASDVQTRSGCAGEGKVSAPELRRDLRSVDGRQPIAPTAGESAAQVEAVRDDVAPRELGAVHKPRDLRTAATSEPHRKERRMIPPCPQCDAANAERVPPVARESRLRWFRCRGCGHLWSIGPPTSSLP